MLSKLNSNILLIILLSTSLGCATFSNRTKSIVTIVGSGIIVGTIASTLAPSDENNIAHGFLFAGTSASLAGIASLFIFDEQKRSREFEREFEVCQKEISVLRGEETGASSKLLYETSTPFGKEVPIEYQKLVSPGKWSVYKLNYWTVQGDNTLIHQDRMIKLIPPTFSPKGLIEDEENKKVPMMETKEEKRKL